MSGAWLLLPVLLPMAGGLPLFQMRRKGLRRGYTLALLTLETVLFCLLSGRAEGGAPLFTLGPDLVFRLRCDGVGRLFGIIVCVLWFIVSIYAFDYMDHEKNQPRFFGFYVVGLGALVGICSAGNLITLYLFYELMTLLTVPLVLHNQEKRSVAAAVKYLGFSVLGAGLSLFSLFFLKDYWTSDLFQGGGILDPAAAAGHEGLLLALYLLMVIGFGAKAGMFPLFTWLPAAHPVAPSPASAVLSGLITKMGVLAILRVTWFVYGPEFLRGTWAQKAALGLAIFTIFIGSMLAYQEKILKRRLAYSTVSQVSYILFGIFLLDGTALRGALLQFVFHAVAKNGLFLAAGALILATGYTRVERLRGVGRTVPVALWGFTLGSLSLIGVPPAGGFVSKWELAQGALESGLGSWAYVGLAVLMVSALLTAGYLLPTVIRGFFPGREEPPALVCPISRGMNGAMLFFGVAVVVLGLFPGLLEGLLGPALSAALR